MATNHDWRDGENGTSVYERAAFFFENVRRFGMTREEVEAFGNACAAAEKQRADALGAELEEAIGTRSMALAEAERLRGIEAERDRLARQNAALLAALRAIAEDVYFQGDVLEIARAAIAEAEGGGQ